ncbi:MAG: nucleotide kinase [Euryarchaeota archaeon]|jgi:nucleoside-triphosphatase|nr:nucleotide kinase [Euryarchaeota archaeon]MAM99728.1 nucleotide kinase [Euryarchaeota archaeon]MAR61072.1 nucleotide kinase [Euryarchaeota archaeon]|tara:strand:+ start:18 stop:578 length:561 start_codon:yes stop_codon:yes gene_type:complete
MGINPKIGITGLPRSGKSAVLDKVVSMLAEEQGSGSETNVIGGMRSEAIIENGERVGYACIDIATKESGVMAHREIDSRNRILGYGIDPTEIDRVGVPAIRNAIGNCEVLVIDEVGKFTVESEGFVDAVREALEYDMPTLLTLHKKSRHPLLQDIRRRDDGRILEVTPVNRALLPYKVLKLISEKP